MRERGYSGGYTMPKALVASLKPQETAAPIVRFETEPGDQMQVDEIAALYDELAAGQHPGPTDRD